MTEFTSAMEQAGIAPPTSVSADGKLHRFQIEGDKPRSKNGWYVLHADPPAGAFGSWKNGISETWSGRGYQSLNPAEKARHKANLEAQKRQREEEQQRIHAECRERATTIWNKATPAPEDHEYLQRKQVKAHGLRQHKGSLVVPVRNGSELHGLQFIDAEGNKTFLTGTAKAGNYCSLGPKPELIVCLVEGLATGATIHEATGQPVAVCFDAGNLRPVAEALRAKLPDIQLVICADNDRQTDNNPGLTKATEAAQAVDGLVAVPEFPKDTPGTDFNDLAAVSGPEEVKRQIEAAKGTSSTKENQAMSAPECSKNQGRLRVQKGCDIQPEPIDWLWPGWLAAGKFHVLAGAPGTGKTTIAVSLAATMSQGGRWPDGSEATKADVAVWSGEDDPNDTLAPRLIAAGANMNRIHFVQGISAGDSTRPFDPATDMPDLREYLLKNPEIRLLIVDPVVSAVSGDSHKNTEVRRNLQPLADLGHECHCAIFGISHFSKGTGGKDPVERVTGSIAFGALARIVMAAAKVEDDSLPEGTRLFARAKSNIGPDSGGWYYQLHNTELKSYPGVFTSEVLWGDTVEGSARELLAAADSADEDGGPALQEAKDFLREELRGGPVSAKKILAEARKVGISDRTLKRAKGVLKIQSGKSGIESGWHWKLPEECHHKTLAPLAPFDKHGLSEAPEECQLGPLRNPEECQAQTPENSEGCQGCQAKRVASFGQESQPEDEGLPRFNDDGFHPVLREEDFEGGIF